MLPARHDDDDDDIHKSESPLGNKTLKILPVFEIQTNPHLKIRPRI